MMTSAEQSVFWRIIDCPSKCFPECSSILEVQQGNCVRQVPEPWSGNLSTARFLIIGSNPALDIKEVFPSKDIFYSKWAPVLYGSASTSLWNDPKVLVEDFFDGRFGSATCGACPGNPVYVRYANSNFEVLKHSFASASLQRAQNPYWLTYLNICNVIAKVLGIKRDEDSLDFAVTDIVHCKSSRQIGVLKALKPCLSHTKDIVDLFLNEKCDTEPIIILVGATANKEYVAKSLFNKPPIHSIIVGDYPHKSGVSPKGEISMKLYQLNGRPYRVYYNIPAPSPANRANRPISLYGQIIKW